MASSHFAPPTPPVFVGENYTFWSIKMKAYLQAFDLWEAVETDKDPSPLRANPTVAQMKQHSEEIAKKYKALSALHAGVSDVMFTRIMACTTAKEVWDKLKEEFQGSARTRQMQVLNLRREFEVLRMKDTETVKEFADRLLKVVNQIRILGEELNDKRVVEKVLVSLPERFEAKISSLEDSRDLNQISLAELINALQAAEQRRTFRQEETSENAFLAKCNGKASIYNPEKKQGGGSRDKNKKDPNASKGVERQKYAQCSYCKKDNHAEKYCWFRPNVQCRACKQLGHVEKVCKNKGRKLQQAQQVQVIDETQQTEERLFVATCYSTSCSKGTWLVDSGCTQHMTHDANLFKYLDRSFTSKVKIGNGEFIEVHGRGDVAVETQTGTKLISNVLYVPEINQSLLSVGQMLENDYSLKFQDKSCIIYDQFGCKILTVAMRDKSFSVDLGKHENNVFYAKSADKSKLWHKRLGHFNYDSLNIMYTKNLVDGMPAVSKKEEVCKICQFGKQKRLPFPSKSSWRASEKLQLIHSDVCGPMSENSLNGCKYFLLFIDDYSRMCWVYFLKQKNEVADAFSNFKALVENQTKSTIKVVRSDNGTEYTAQKFETQCKEAGIQHQLTSPYTPQQNGVSERKNRTVMEMSRCLMFEKHLPKKFWAESVNTSVYLLNRLPSKALEFKTPYEIWYGVKPSLEHLKVFGSICYVHVPEIKRDKLDQKADIGILVGYSSNTKGYRVYQLKTNKLVVSRNVKVDEAAAWNWEKEEVQTLENSFIQEQDEIQEETLSEDENATGIRGMRPLTDIYERCNVAVSDPVTFEEASQSENWRKAMETEISMINKNKTWELVSKPEGRDAIGVKWIFRTKYNADGSVNKHKARLVVKGYVQQYGVDYGDTFAPVARHDTIRLLLAISAQKGWKVFHLDVKSAFLNGFLHEEIYVQQPDGFVINGHEEKVYKLYKALYGLKQAPRAWYSRIDSYLVKQGFKRSDNEPTLYVKTGDAQLIISLYVDDLLVTGGDMHHVMNFKLEMQKEFDMSDLGLMKYFVGMEIWQFNHGIFLSQKKYALELLTKFHMENSKPTATPLVQNLNLVKDDGAAKIEVSAYRSLIGSLLYLTATRPDLMYATSLLSRFMNSASENHFAAAKRILRYVKGTTDYGIWYHQHEKCKLMGYTDSDWAGSKEDMKSTSGYVFSLGSGPFSWSSKKQEVVAQSTAEAEYISAAAAANQAIWLRKLLDDLNEQQKEATIMYCDNKSAIAIAENPIQHGRTKHISIKYHAIREAERNAEIKLVHCSSEKQLADIFTKSLPKIRFETLRSELCVSSKSAKEEC